MSKKTENVPATTSEQAAPQAPAVVAGGNFDVSNFEVVKDVVLPILQLPVGVTRGVQITDAMFEGKTITTSGKAAKKPATLANVINLATGERSQIVVPAVLEANLRETYPDDGYVNLYFAIQNEGKREGKDYNDFRIVEIKPKAG
jgi:hypothetical protein